MAGTTPLNIHVPAKAPIISNISIAGSAAVMLLTICSCMLIHLYFKRSAIIAATAAESNNAI